MRQIILALFTVFSQIPALAEPIFLDGKERHLYEILYQNPEQDLLKLLVFPLQVATAGSAVLTRTISDAYPWDILQQQALFGVQYEVSYETPRLLSPDSTSDQRLGVRSRKISLLHLYGPSVETVLLSVVHCDTVTAPGDTLTTGEPRCASYLSGASWLKGDSTEAAVLRAWAAQGDSIVVHRARREAEDQQRAEQAAQRAQEALER